MPVDAFSRNDQAALVSDGSSRWVPPHLVCLVQPRCSGKRSIAPSAVFGAGRGGSVLQARSVAPRIADLDPRGVWDLDEYQLKLIVASAIGGESGQHGSSVTNGGRDLCGHWTCCLRCWAFGRPTT